MTGSAKTNRDEREIASLLAHLGFMKAMQDAPPREQLEARVEKNPDDYEAAILKFLELLKRDRHFNDAVARKGLTAIFNMLGGEHELVVKYRKQLMNLIF
ncbi:MAG: tetratricopeptide repeat protein [Gammaproteobacteria bacterium]|nr:tetratricopeptide repeat protein [Gammaproteobacteria bacterium]